MPCSPNDLFIAKDKRHARPQAATSANVYQRFIGRIVSMIKKSSTAALLLCALSGPYAASSATLVVNSAADTFDPASDCSVSCTLREAIELSSLNGKITFAPAMLPAVISLEYGALTPFAVTIEGPGASLLAIDAHLSDRVVRVFQNAGTVTISGVALINGRTVGAPGADAGAASAASGGKGADAFGGCILVDQMAPSTGPTVKLIGVTLRNCTAQGGVGGRGGSGLSSAAKAGGTGGAGGVGGVAAGGAIYAGFQSDVRLEQTSIIDAHVIGGAGGKGGDGGVGDPFRGNGGGGGVGGQGRGGAIYLSVVKQFRATNVTVADADAQGGKGGNGGGGDPDFQLSQGGAGGNGGDAHGGLFVGYGGSLNVFQFATLGEGVVTPGLHGSGGRAAIAGIGGQDGAASVPAVQVVIPNPSAQGLYPTYLLRSAVFATSAAPVCEGQGFLQATNSFASDGSCAATAAGDLDSWFKPLTLASDVPAYVPRFGRGAIDATDCVAVPGDLLATPRPQGVACDIGAIEADYIFVGEFD